MPETNDIYLTRREIIKSIIEISPHRGAELARRLFSLMSPTSLTHYMAQQGISNIAAISQGLHGDRCNPGTQRARVRPLVAEFLGLAVEDLWPPEVPVGLGCTAHGSNSLPGRAGKAISQGEA